MKKFFKLCSLVLSFVFATTFLAVLAACGPADEGDPGDNGDNNPPAHTHTFEKGWTYNDTDHWHKADCGHEEIADKAAHEFSGNRCTVCGYEKTVEKTAKCDIYCPVCGKCMDVYCQEDTEKCGDGLTSHIFEGECSEIKDSASSNIKCRRSQDYGDDDYINDEYIAVFYLTGSNGASCTFKINASKDCVVTFRVRAGYMDYQSVYTESMSVLINGEFLENDAYLIGSPEGKRDKWFFDWVNLGCISLHEGENTIELIAFSGDPAIGHTLDKIELLSDSSVELTWQETDNTSRYQWLEES